MNLCVLLDSYILTAQCPSSTSTLFPCLQQRDPHYSTDPQEDSAPRTIPDIYSCGGAQVCCGHTVTCQAYVQILVKEIDLQPFGDIPHRLQLPWHHYEDTVSVCVGRPSISLVEGSDSWVRLRHAVISGMPSASKVRIARLNGFIWFTRSVSTWKRGVVVASLVHVTVWTYCC